MRCGVAEALDGARDAVVVASVVGTLTLAGCTRAEGDVRTGEGPIARVTVDPPRPSAPVSHRGRMALQGVQGPCGGGVARSSDAIQ
jgi:hypothetical protein